GTCVGVQGGRTAAVSNQDVGRRVVGVDARPAVELGASETGSVLVVGEVAILPVAGVIAEEIIRTGAASRDVLGIPHQDRLCVRARRYEALVTVALPGLFARQLGEAHTAGSICGVEQLGDRRLEVGERP